MSTTTVKAGSQNNNGGSLLHAGNVASSLWTNLSLNDNATDYPQPHVQLAGGTPGQSGNLGTIKPLSAGVFGKMETGKYVAKIIGTRIAQTDDTFLRSGAGDVGNRRAIHVAKGNRRYDITDVSAFSGVVSYGGNEGVLFTYVDPNTGAAQAEEPLPTRAVPGELTYMVKGTVPTQDDYKAITG